MLMSVSQRSGQREHAVAGIPQNVPILSQNPCCQRYVAMHDFARASSVMSLIQEVMLRDAAGLKHFANALHTP